jgi:hypothetical protein
VRTAGRYENQSEGASAGASRLAVGGDGTSRTTTIPAATRAAPSTSAACCAHANVASVVAFSEAQDGSTAESNHVRSRLVSIKPEPVHNKVLCIVGAWHIQSSATAAIRRCASAVPCSRRNPTKILHWSWNAGAREDVQVPDGDSAGKAPVNKSRASASLLLACAATAACGVQPPALGREDVTHGGSASCAAPYVETSPRQAQPGQILTVVGRYYLDGCYDTGESRETEPLDDLLVTFTQGTETTEYGRYDADPDGTVQTTIAVPAQAEPGLAEVTLGTGSPALVLVGDGQGGFPPWPGPPKGPFELTVALHQMPTFPEGGYVIASATTVDFQVPDSDKRVVVVEPLPVSDVSLGELGPTYWMVGVSVYRCARPGCPPPEPSTAEPADTCEMEARLFDRPVQMAYTYLGPGQSGCELRGDG